MNPSSPHPAYNSPEGRDIPDIFPAVVPTSDAELIRRMATGDEAALGLLYDRFAPMVASMAGGILSDPDDVEEVVEEAFWQAWRDSKRYAPGRGGVSTWIGVIARSRALDRLRKQRRLRETAIEDVPTSSLEAPASSRSTSPLQHAADAERRDRVAAALDELPPEQRQALELTYFHGMSQSEISAHTDQPLGTVKTRVRLAMRKLKERLSPLREELG